MRPAWLGFACLCCILALVFVGLSAWQFEQAYRPQESSAEGVRPLSEVLAPSIPVTNAAAGRLVSFAGEFRTQRTFIVQNRVQNAQGSKTRGYWVTTFMEVAGSGAQALVVLGWAPTVELAREGANEFARAVAAGVSGAGPQSAAAEGAGAGGAGVVLSSIIAQLQPPESPLGFGPHQLHAAYRQQLQLPPPHSRPLSPQQQPKRTDSHRSAPPSAQPRGPQPHPRASTPAPPARNGPHQPQAGSSPAPTSPPTHTQTSAHPLAHPSTRTGTQTPNHSHHQPTQSSNHTNPSPTNPPTLLPVLSPAVIINLPNSGFKSELPLYSGYFILKQVPPGLHSLESVQIQSPPIQTELDLLNVFYGIEWLLFAGFVIWLYLILLKDAYRLEKRKLTQKDHNNMNLNTNPTPAHPHNISQPSTHEQQTAQSPSAHTTAIPHSKTFAFYRTSSWITGILLILLSLEMIFKYIFFLELDAFGAFGTLALVPDGTTTGINLSRWILIAHGWFYVVYIISSYLLWRKSRINLLWLGVMILGGVVPFMSIIVEQLVARKVKYTHTDK